MNLNKNSAILSHFSVFSTFNRRTLALALKIYVTHALAL
jgi:hypothetical protein